MPRRALHTDDTKIEQKPDLKINHGGPTDAKVPLPDRSGDIIEVDGALNADYADALAFNEEPVTIRLEPSAEKNAPSAFPVWVNGKGCEVFENGRWNEITYIPVGRAFVVKRKYVEVIIRAKVDTVSTLVSEPESENPSNVIRRFSSAVHSFSILEDKNPKGAAWIQELRRRNF